MSEILLVADVPWVVDALRAALGGTDYRLHIVEDPAAVAAYWEEHRPALAVVDLQVGSRGGMAVVRDLRDTARSMEQVPPATVLLLDRGVDAFLARRAGADAWMRKPFGGFALRRLLDGLLAARDADTPAG